MRIVTINSAVQAIRNRLNPLDPNTLWLIEDFDFILDIMSELDGDLGVWPEDFEAFWRVAKLLRLAVDVMPPPPRPFGPNTCGRPNKNGSSCANKLRDGYIACHKHATHEDIQKTRAWQNLVHYPYKRATIPAPPPLPDYDALARELLDIAEDLK